MSGNDKARGPGRKIVRERALKILKETRAGMDPAFLAKMAERFSGLVPGTPKAEPTDIPVKPASVPAPSVAKNTPSVTMSEPARSPQPTKVKNADAEMVDKEKIRRIVLDYMKNRDEKPRH